MGRTLWEMLKDKFQGAPQGASAEGRAQTRSESDDREPPSPPPEVPLKYNPLDLQIGGYFTIDCPDYLDKDFRVFAIREVSVHLDNQDFTWVEYRAAGEGDDTAVLLRVEPHVDADRPETGRTFCMVAARLREEFGYSDDFMTVMNECQEKGCFQITNDDTGKLEAEYYRDKGLPPIPATVTAVGKDARPGAMRYWAFSRKIDAGIEHLFVEMSDKDGWFSIYVGLEIDSVNVKTF